MKCFFCNQSIGVLDIDNEDYELICENHSLHVIHKYGNITHGLLNVLFHVSINDASFAVDLKPMEDQTFITKITKEGTESFQGYSSPVFGSEIVGNFNYLIDITPENAEHKIKTILTFS